MNAARLFLLPLLAGLSAALASGDEGQGRTEQLTLDPALYAEALREVQGVVPPAPAATPPVAESPGQTDERVSPAIPPSSPEPTSAPGVEDWQAALRDAGTELADVRLLVLLQRLNPLEPPSARAEDYAEALRLHHLMLAGNARACLSLARACRDGHFESGLLFIQSESLAVLLERRAAAFQLPPAISEAALPGEGSAPAGRSAK